jgi:hypothetical protein
MCAPGGSGGEAAQAWRREHSRRIGHSPGNSAVTESNQESGMTERGIPHRHAVAFPAAEVVRHKRERWNGVRHCSKGWDSGTGMELTKLQRWRWLKMQWRQRLSRVESWRKRNGGVRGCCVGLQSTQSMVQGCSPVASAPVKQRVVRSIGKQCPENG